MFRTIDCTCTLTAAIRSLRSTILYTCVMFARGMHDGTITINYYLQSDGDPANLNVVIARKLQNHHKSENNAT